MNGIIEHEGIVVDVIGSRVDVKIEAQSGCAGCAARSACGMSESQDKMVTVFIDEAEAYAPGEQVMVSVERAMGIKAVMYAYVFPFLLLLVALLTLLELGATEAVAGLTSLGLIGVYYLGLYLMRGRIEREIIFKLRRITN